MAPLPPATGGPPHLAASEAARPRRRGVVIVALVAFVAVLTAAIVLATHLLTSDDDAPFVPEEGAWWGMYVPPPGDGSSLYRAVTEMESMLGRRLDIVFTYHDMSTSDSGLLIKGDEPRLGEERILLLSWEAKIWSENRDLHWRDIADGVYDASVIDPQAERIKAYGKRVMLGFDGEMERKTGSGSPEDYVAAYRHIHDRFEELGVDNVVWVWAVTGYSEYRDRWKSFYPGHEYVDWISYDPYNFGPCRDAPWQSFEQTLRPTYEWFQANGFADKPIIIGEYGTEADPDRPDAKAAWYRDIPRVLPSMPNIKALLQWNAVLEDQRACDFRLQGPGVLEAFAEAGRSPYLNQPIP
ncbi:glycoside hydrolase family 26 protein [Thermostaphylospora chromogena]|uniref:Glycosyl hydrolase family 26 n=1 Tax=Thermostaphylospora chromogena TaxID=35622 RepID=A0A1H1CMF0_9ACTN|nr:glycosyl hydrolase [Thermostaphylospora chromogena]SDQ65451.1 Glycosyl hydrolase family 26 [Thermostaphylospora chromogena]